MRRHQTFHEALIPLLVKGIGAEKYLEFGTHLNETYNKVKCKRKWGVDINAKIPACFKMTTAEFILEHAARCGPFDFVFIDADHSAEAVLADFYGIWPYVSPEGLVICHDTNPQYPEDTIPGLCGDAWKSAQEISKRHESVTLPYHPGLTIIRKREKWGPA